MLKLDEYCLIKFLGKGTFGEVYLTKKENSNNLFATKRLEKKLAENPNYKKYFNNEITILNQLKHENIINLYDIKVTQNNYYIIMEYCNGGSLSQCLKRYKELYHQPFTEEIVQHIMHQIISAIKLIHSKRIIHRDLKLDNILVNFKTQEDYTKVNLLNADIKIIDFGFSTTKEDMNGTAVGSPLNMDPLILKKFNSNRIESKDIYYDEKADIWSLGALCYQMLLGNNPFNAYNMKELMEKINEGTYKIPTYLSKEVVSFLNGMLQYNPYKRLTAENLFLHPFLNKDVKEFTHINTNLVKKNVYGGHLNININDNQSIWAIFNENDRKLLDDIPYNLFTQNPHITKSVYVPNENIKSQEIGPNNYDENQKFIDENFSKVDSVPIIDNTATISFNPNYQENLINNKNNNLDINANNQIEQKPKSQIVTFQNGFLFSEQNNQDNNNNAEFEKIKQIMNNNKNELKIVTNENINITNEGNKINNNINNNNNKMQYNPNQNNINNPQIQPKYRQQQNNNMNPQNIPKQIAKNPIKQNPGINQQIKNLNINPYNPQTIPGIQQNKIYQTKPGFNNNPIQNQNQIQNMATNKYIVNNQQKYNTPSKGIINNPKGGVVTPPVKGRGPIVKPIMGRPIHEYKTDNKVIPPQQNYNGVNQNLMKKYALPKQTIPQNGKYMHSPGQFMANK